MIHIDVLEFGADTVPIGLDVPLSAGSAAEPPALSSRTVLYIMVPRWAPSGQIDTLVNQLDDQYREAAELIVLRIHPQQLRGFRESTAPEDLAARFPGKPIFVLTWTDEFALEQCSGPELQLGSETASLLAALRHAEARALLERSGVVLPADETFHYEGPNGRHYESFVRVGTAIQSIDALDGLAFWLLDELTRSPLILLDSWTILSLGLNCERYLSEVERTIQEDAGVEPGSAKDAARVIAVECQRRYGEPQGRLQQRLSSLYREHRDAPPPVLVLMSVSSTGESAETLRDECKQAGFKEAKATSIFVATGAEQEGFCALPEITAHWDETECPRCDEGSQSVRVMSDTYLLDLAATVRSDVAIRLPHAEQARDFFSRYGGTGVVSLHRTQEDDERHHMVYLDVRALLGQEAFRDRLEDEVGQIEKIDLVLCPEHKAGEELAKLVSERLGCELIVANPERLLKLEPAERERLESARRILVVDDIVMTGTRLRRYRNDLLRADIATREDFELHFLAGVARPDSLRALQGIVDYTHFDHRFHYVELLVLPNWDRKECPWCAELKLLEQYGAAVEHNAAMRQRRDALKDTASGLATDPFLDWLGGNPPPVDPWQLGPNSIFGARTPPELFAAVAHALQVLRSEGELNDHFTLPVARILDRRFTFSGRFYDTVITACLLRATRRHDLRAPATDSELEAEVRERLRDGAHASLQGELLFAIFRRHLPGHRLDEIAVALADEQAEAGIRQLLAEALDSA